MTPIKKLVQIGSWSLSRLGDYDKCPALAKFKVIDRLREPEGPASAKGTRVHELAAAYITAARAPRPIPPELWRFEAEFKALRADHALAERSWSFTREWEPCEATDWGRAWLRMKVDAHYLKSVRRGGGRRETEVVVIDHKTGKIYPEHARQRSIYALGALLTYPDAARVTVAHWYLELGEESERETWEARQLADLRKEWTRRSRAMLADTTFAPRPGEYCKYCHFRKANGGPCVF
jgi:PD-(D/E)XK nuclease superfamily